MLAVVLLIRLRREQADFCNFEQYPSRVSTLPTFVEERARNTQL